MTPITPDTLHPVRVALSLRQLGCLREEASRNFSSVAAEVRRAVDRHLQSNCAGENQHADR
jgi:hypothetical protein